MQVCSSKPAVSSILIRDAHLHVCTGEHQAVLGVGLELEVAVGLGVARHHERAGACERAGMSR